MRPDTILDVARSWGILRAATPSGFLERDEVNLVQQSLNGKSEQQALCETKQRRLERLDKIKCEEKKEPIIPTENCQKIIANLAAQLRLTILPFRRADISAAQYRIREDFLFRQRLPLAQLGEGPLVLDCHRHVPYPLKDAVSDFIATYYVALDHGNRALEVIHGYGASGKGGILNGVLKGKIIPHQQRAGALKALESNPGKTTVLPQHELVDLADNMWLEIAEMIYVRRI